MNKLPLLFITLFLSTFTSSAKERNVHYENFKKISRHNIYYASYYFIKQALKQNPKAIPAGQVYKTLDLVYPAVFIHDKELDNFISVSTALDYYVALRNFFRNRLDIAEQKLTPIKKNHPMYLEKSYMMGLLSLRKKNVKKARYHFVQCVLNANAKKLGTLKSEKHIRTFRNRCIQQNSILYYSKKQFKKSIDILNKVHKTDFIWPQLLLDKSWSYYWRNEKERALGVLLAFNAPILQRYMVPEASYLKALLYYEKCQYEKTEEIIKQFESVTYKNRTLFRNISPKILYKLIFSEKPPKKAGHIELYYYLKGFKKDIRFFTYLESKSQLNSEANKLKKVAGSANAKYFLGQLKSYEKVMDKDFQDFLMRLAQDYLEQILRTRKHFVKLNLLINSRKRKMLSHKKEKKSKEYSIKNLDDIKDTDDKFIWNFKGGFWADELGDYAISLENRC